MNIFQRFCNAKQSINNRQPVAMNNSSVDDRRAKLEREHMQKMREQWANR